MKRGVILIILVLVLAGGIGWYVWAENKNDDSNNNSTFSTSTQNNDDYLVIKEWGVRMKLNNKIKDAKYQITEDGTGAYLSTTSAERVKGCESGKISGLDRGKEGDTVGATTANSSNVPPMIKLGDYYYLNTGPSFSCADGSDTEGKNKIGEIRLGFREAINSLEHAQ